MSDPEDNPFLEGSEQVPDEEATEAAQMLATEAAAVRARSSKIREKAAKAKAEKEAARKAEIARMDAQVEAARAEVIRMVASIPKTSEDSTARPAPPPAIIAESATGPVIAFGMDNYRSRNQPPGIRDLIPDFVLATVTITFTVLIFLDM